LAILIALFAAPEDSISQTVEDWDNPTTGSWFTATNWSTNTPEMRSL
jgi:hypothetical protein